MSWSLANLEAMQLRKTWFLDDSHLSFRNSADHSMMPEDGDLGVPAFISRQHTFAARRSAAMEPSSSTPVATNQPDINDTHSEQKLVNKTCADKRCVSLLSESSYMIYKHCEKETFRKRHIREPDIPYKCVFRDGRGHDPVALASCPGSGNTWVRGMLEKATGICTGSVYCDYDLRNGGYVGESIRDGSVIAIKTHLSDIHWKNGSQVVQCNEKNSTCYGSAIFVIRNPFHSLVAERHRLKAHSHVSLINNTQFGNYQLEIVCVISLML